MQMFCILTVGKRIFNSIVTVLNQVVHNVWLLEHLITRFH